MRKILKEFDISSFKNYLEGEGIDDVEINYSYAYSPDSDEDDEDDEDDDDDRCPSDCRKSKCYQDDDDYDYDDDEDDEDEDDDEEDEMEVTHEYEGKTCVKEAKANPANVLIAEGHDNRYYIAMSDVMSYIEAADLNEVESAVENIAEANNINVDNITIVLPENAEEIYGPRLLKAMDESTLVFEMG